MPLRGKSHSNRVGDEAPYFTSLSALDSWADTASTAVPLSSVLPFTPRSDAGEDSTSGQQGKLLLCHDYKGGYTEKPSALAYTFNFWQFAETFIYFAHHRITIPPSGWTTAAHRQGVRMLGTIIFEHAESQADCLRLLVGRLPRSQTGPALPPPRSIWPISRHYARILADLAYERGFDGYLVNVEVQLSGGIEQTRALSSWVGLLEHELRSRIGGHAQVIWYDSIVINGQLAWQDRLNNYNLPFFPSSSAFFTNYTWPPEHPSLTAQYFLSLKPEHTAVSNRMKRLQDIFFGVDVWGRGQHGGGGLGCYKAISHIDPASLGLSVALFGHAWTWETQEDHPGWNWEAWWAYERLFWVGPEDSSEIPGLEDVPDRHGRLCEHGPYQPVSSFFNTSPPPNPIDLPFFTSFSPGVGRAWFVNGAQVWEAEEGSLGWTDMDKNNSLGNLLWPKPTLSWHDMEREDALPTTSSLLETRDAWLGGSSLRVSLAVPSSDTDDAFFRCVWLPIQSLSVTPQKSYTVCLVYKADEVPDQSVELDVGLSVKPLQAGHEVHVDSQSDTRELALGWQQLSVQFTLRSNLDRDAQISVGLVLGAIVADPTRLARVSALIGSIAAYPAFPSSTAHLVPRLLWLDFDKSTSIDNRTPEPFVGLLKWDTGGYYAESPPRLTSVSPEDPTPAWFTKAPPPSFLYFNVYVLALPTPPGEAALPTNASFVGTTGLAGHADRFFVDAACLPKFPDATQSVRFYVQGLTNHGVLLPWEDCVFVDVNL